MSRRTMLRPEHQSTPGTPRKVRWPCGRPRASPARESTCCAPGRETGRCNVLVSDRRRTRLPHLAVRGSMESLTKERRGTPC